MSSLLVAAIAAIATLTLVAAFAAVLRRRFKSQEIAHQDTENRHGALFAYNPDAVFEFDLMGNFVSANAVAEEISGYEASELIGSHFGALLPPGELEIALEHLVEPLEGSAQTYETTIFHKAGHLVPLNVTNVPIFSEGALVGTYGVARDITEDRETETALKESEERNRAVVETAPDAVITMSSEGVILSFNGGAERIFGYASEEATGQPLRMLMPERFKEPHEKGFRRYLETGEAHVIGGTAELAGLRKDGTEFPLELSLGETRGEEDRAFLGIIRDITARKEAESELRENERRFRQFFEQSVDALMVHDEHGYILDANAEAARSLGYTPEEMLSLQISNYLITR